MIHWKSNIEIPQQHWYGVNWLLGFVPGKAIAALILDSERLESSHVWQFFYLPVWFRSIMPLSLRFERVPRCWQILISEFSDSKPA